MKLSFGTLVALAALTTTTLATSDASSALAMAQASYPKCTVSTIHNPSIVSSYISDDVVQLGCLAELIPQSACTLTDINCLCTNVPLNANLTVCVLSSCTTYEGLGKQLRPCRRDND